MIQTQATVIAIEYSPDGLVAQIFFRVEERFDFQEGQFVFLERLGFQSPDGKAMKRAYSIGTPQSVMQKEGIFSTIVKRTSEFGMSAYLTQEIAVGDQIKLTGSLGHMVDQGKSQNYLLVSIGSGITPLHALYLSLLEKQQFSQIAYVFGERYASNLLPSVVSCYKENTDNSALLHRMYLSAEENLPDTWQSGHVQDALPVVLDFLGSDFQVFLCGKSAMVDDVTRFLLDNGVHESLIHSEKY